MKEGVMYRMALGLVPVVFRALTFLLFCTYRIKVHGQKYWDQVEDSGKPAVGSFWHYSVFFCLYFMRKKSGVAMVSASSDGEFVSRIVESLGYVTVRGSRNKGGLQAIKSMIRYMRAGRNAAIVADGSQGPARVVQAGCIVLASRAKAPILPMIWSCSRYKRFGSWDKTALPLPFSQVDFFYGELLDVPEKIKSAEIERYRLILEQRLNDLYDEAWALYGKSEH